MPNRIRINISTDENMYSIIYLSYCDECQSPYLAVRFIEDNLRELQAAWQEGHINLKYGVQTKCTYCVENDIHACPPYYMYKSYDDFDIDIKI